MSITKEDQDIKWRKLQLDRRERKRHISLVTENTEHYGKYNIDEEYQY